MWSGRGAAFMGRNKLTPSGLFAFYRLFVEVSTGEQSANYTPL